MTPQFAVVMDNASDARDPWNAQGSRAVERFAAQGHKVHLLSDPPSDPDRYAAIVLHGCQYEDWIRKTMNDTSAHLIMSDVPASPFDYSPLVTVIDWGWPEAAHAAGRAAGRASTSKVVGFISGPPVRTQQRTRAQFERGAAEEGARTIVHTLRSFADIGLAESSVRDLNEKTPCDVVGHSADSAGSDAVRVAAALGMQTIDFLQSAHGTLGWIRSNISDVLVGTMLDVTLDRRPPARVVCNEANGLVGYVALRH